MSTAATRTVRRLQNTPVTTETPPTRRIIDARTRHREHLMVNQHWTGTTFRVPLDWRGRSAEGRLRRCRPLLIHTLPPLPVRGDAGAGVVFQTNTRRVGRVVNY
jgi:hypothetical protein